MMPLQRHAFCRNGWLHNCSMQIFQQSPLTSLILMTNTDVSTNKAIDHVSTTEHATMEKVKHKKHLNFSSSFYPNQCLRTILGEVRPHLAIKVAFKINGWSFGFSVFPFSGEPGSKSSVLSWKAGRQGSGTKQAKWLKKCGLPQTCETDH